MKFILSGLQVLKKMKLFDVSIYKTMLFAVGLLGAHVIPWFGSLSPLVWLIIGIVCLGYLMTFTYRTRDDADGYFETVMANFRDYRILDAVAFELGMVAIGLAAYQYIPWFGTIDTGRYIGIVAFGSAWLISMWTH